jgi:Flp pilus assembly protein TadG
MNSVYTIYTIILIVLIIIILIIGIIELLIYLVIKKSKTNIQDKINKTINENNKTDINTNTGF